MNATRSRFRVWTAGFATLAAWMVALALAGRFAWAWCFGQFVEYDDQGYLMVAVQHLLDGRRPYDEIAVPYGPVWFLERWLLHAVLRVPLTTDAVRWITLASWCASATCLGLALARVLRGRPGALGAGLAGMLLVALLVRALALEPGHPQELYVLLTALAVLAAASLAERPVLSSVVWGAFAGALLLVKVNLGLLAFAGLTIGLDLADASGRRARVVRGALCLGAMTVPCVLMWGQLDAGWVRAMASTSTLGALALALVHLRSTARTPDAHAARRACRGFAAGFALVLLAGVGFALVRGATPAAMLTELLLAPLRHPRAFGVQPVELGGSVAVNAAGAACAVAWALCSEPRRARLNAWVLPWIRLAFLGLVVFRRGEACPLFEYGVGWCWVLLAPFHVTGAPGIERWRRALVWLALFERLQAYPVAGSQVYVGVLAWVPLAVWGGLDAVTQLAARRPVAGHVARGSLALFALYLAGSVWMRGDALLRVHARNEPLGLAGAELVRTSHLQVVRTRWLAQNLARGPSAFVSVLGSNSLYMWTGKRPPTTLLVSHAWDLLPARGQTDLVEALLIEPDPWVVDHPGLLGPVVRARSPFFEWVGRELSPFAHFASYTLLCRTERADPELTGSAWFATADELPPALSALASPRMAWITLAPADASLGVEILGIGVQDTESRTGIVWTAHADDRLRARLHGADGRELLSHPPGRAWRPASGERAWLHAPNLPSAVVHHVLVVDAFDARSKLALTLPLVTFLRR